MTPAEAATNTVSTATGPDANRGARSYSVSGLDNDARFVLELHAAGDITIDDNGVVRFANNTRIADASNTAIEIVNGLAVGGAAGSGTEVARVANIAPQNGSISFVIDSTTAVSVRPVLYIDANNSGNLSLATGTGAQVPTNDFGVGGQKSWVPAEAAAFAAVAAGAVVSVDTAARTFTLDTNVDGIADVLVRWAPGDTHMIDSTNDGTANLAITQAQFETWVSVGDRIAGITNYNPGANAVNITRDRPGAPTNVAANYRTQQANVLITFTRPTNPNATHANTTYQLQRAPVTDGTVGTFANVGATITGAVTAEFVDAPAPGTYAYRVNATVPVAGTGPNSAAAQATVPAAAAPQLVSVATAPAAHQITIIDANASNTLTSGDTVTVTFNEPMSVPAANATITFQDGDGTNVSVTNGVHATFTRSGDANNVITVNVTAAPVTVAPGDTAGLQYVTAFVADASGVTDSTATLWNAAVASANIGGATCVAPLGVISVPGATGANPFTPTAAADACSSGTITASGATDTVTGAAGAVAAGATVNVATAGAPTVSIGTATAAADGSFSITTTTPFVNLAPLVVRQSVQRTATTVFTSADGAITAGP